MSVFTDMITLYTTIRKVVTRRRDRRVMERLIETRGPVPAGSVAIVVYFADSEVNLYQARQWYEPRAELARHHGVAFLARNVAGTRALLEESPIPVVHRRTISEIEAWMATQPVTTIYYVNQNMRNFQMMRFRDPAHVFISHGESDKDYMASNQLKAYDYTFIAGQAAHERLTKRLVGYDVAARTMRIGRPQVDVDHVGPTLPADGRLTVLYAPTWEGDRPSMCYSSVESHGPALVAALAATGRHRIVYRPHPRTGAFDPRYRAVHDDLVRAITAANDADPGAQHVIDTESAFGWHLRAADAAIADISAVAFDWLATGKPLLLTEPASHEAEVDRDGIAGLLPTLEARRAPEVARIIDEAFESSATDAYRAIAERYFGDTTPGSSMTRFLAAAETVHAERAPLVAEARTMVDPFPHGEQS